MLEVPQISEELIAKRAKDCKLAYKPLIGKTLRCLPRRLNKKHYPKFLLSHGTSNVHVVVQVEVLHVVATVPVTCDLVPSEVNDLVRAASTDHFCSLNLIQSATKKFLSLSWTFLSGIILSLDLVQIIRDLCELCQHYSNILHSRSLEELRFEWLLLRIDEELKAQEEFCIDKGQVHFRFNSNYLITIDFQTKPLLQLTVPVQLPSSDIEEFLNSANMNTHTGCFRVNGGQTVFNLSLYWPETNTVTFSAIEQVFANDVQPYVDAATEAGAWLPSHGTFYSIAEYELRVNPELYSIRDCIPQNCTKNFPLTPDERATEENYLARLQTVEILVAAFFTKSAQLSRDSVQYSVPQYKMSLPIELAGGEREYEAVLTVLTALRQIGLTTSEPLQHFRVFGSELHFQYSQPLCRVFEPGELPFPEEIIAEYMERRCVDSHQRFADIDYLSQSALESVCLGTIPITITTLTNPAAYKQVKTVTTRCKIPCFGIVATHNSLRIVREACDDSLSAAQSQSRYLFSQIPHWAHDIAEYIRACAGSCSHCFGLSSIFCTQKARVDAFAPADVSWPVLSQDQPGLGQMLQCFGRILHSMYHSLSSIPTTDLLASDVLSNKQDRLLCIMPDVEVNYPKVAALIREVCTVVPLPGILDLISRRDLYL